MRYDKRNNYIRLNDIYIKYINNAPCNFTDLYNSLYRMTRKLFLKLDYSLISYEDTFHNTIVKLISKKPQLNGDIVTLFYVMFKNTYLDNIRYEKRHNHYKLNNNILTHNMLQ